MLGKQALHMVSPWATSPQRPDRSTGRARMGSARLARGPGSLRLRSQHCDARAEGARLLQVAPERPRENCARDLGDQPLPGLTKQLYRAALASESKRVFTPFVIRRKPSSGALNAGLSRFQSRLWVDWSLRTVKSVPNQATLSLAPPWDTTVKSAFRVQNYGNVYFWRCQQNDSQGKCRL